VAAHIERHKALALGGRGGSWACGLHIMQWVKGRASGRGFHKGSHAAPHGVRMQPADICRQRVIVTKTIGQAGRPGPRLAHTHSHTLAHAHTCTHTHTHTPLGCPLSPHAGPPAATAGSSR
jgi:hypothetical protein